MADPQKLGPTTSVRPNFKVASRYKTPRPYESDVTQTARSLVSGASTRASNGNNRPPVSVSNRRIPGKDYDKRTQRMVNRYPAVQDGKSFTKGSI